MRILVSTICLSLWIVTCASAKIVIAARVDEGVKGIFVMEDDGTGVTELLTDTRYPTQPRWSPDGKLIVFDRKSSPNDSQHKQIVVMNADGTNQRTLTEPRIRSRYPVFSPDGKSIVYFRSERIGNGPLEDSICVIDLVDDKKIEITDFPGLFFDWSPLGDKILFSTPPTLGKSGSNLWIMDGDGGRAHALLPPPPLGEVLIDRGYARWFPNGKKILYYEYESMFIPKDGFIPQAHRYFIYDLSTKQKKQLLIPKTYRCSSLDWMDNGKSIVFSAVEIKLNDPVGIIWHSYHLYKYDIAKGTFIRLSDRTWENPSLDWISDDVFPVTPIDKKQIQWGSLKLHLPE